MQRNRRSLFLQETYKIREGTIPLNKNSHYGDPSIVPGLLHEAMPMIDLISKEESRITPRLSAPMYSEVPFNTTTEDGLPMIWNIAPGANCSAPPSRSMSLQSGISEQDSAFAPTIIAEEYRYPPETDYNGSYDPLNPEKNQYIHRLDSGLNTSEEQNPMSFDGSQSTTSQFLQNILDETESHDFHFEDRAGIRKRDENGLDQGSPRTFVSTADSSVSFTDMADAMTSSSTSIPSTPAKLERFGQVDLKGNNSPAMRNLVEEHGRLLPSDTDEEMYHYYITEQKQSVIKRAISDSGELSSATRQATRVALEEMGHIRIATDERDTSYELSPSFPATYFNQNAGENVLKAPLSNSRVETASTASSRLCLSAPEASFTSSSCASNCASIISLPQDGSNSEDFVKETVKGGVQIRDSDHRRRQLLRSGSPLRHSPGHLRSTSTSSSSTSCSVARGPSVRRGITRRRNQITTVRSRVVAVDSSHCVGSELAAKSELMKSSRACSVVRLFQWILIGAADFLLESCLRTTLESLFPNVVYFMTKKNTIMLTIFLSFLTFLHPL
jgi:hypothetical protein